MRPWSANPKWVPAFDDFPLDSVAVKAELFGRAADENWTIVLSHEPVHPVGAWSATETALGSIQASETAPSASSAAEEARDAVTSRWAP